MKLVFVAIKQGVQPILSAHAREKLHIIIFYSENMDKLISAFTIFNALALQSGIKKRCVQYPAVLAPNGGQVFEGEFLIGGD